MEHMHEVVNCWDCQLSIAMERGLLCTRRGVVVIDPFTKLPDCDVNSVAVYTAPGQSMEELIEKISEDAGRKEETVKRLVKGFSEREKIEKIEREKAKKKAKNVEVER